MNILYLAANADNADLIRGVLLKCSRQFTLDLVTSIREASLRLAQPVCDVLLTDLHLVDGEALTLLAQLRAQLVPVAVVILAEHGDVEAAVAAMKAGADDVVVKRGDFLTLLPAALDGALQHHRDSNYADRLRVLSCKLLEIQEAERRHLARELHDELGQLLTMISVNMKSVRSKIDPALGTQLDDGIAIVDRAVECVRNLSLDLRPSILDDFGLEAALRWYTNRLAERTGLAVTFVVDSSLSVELRADVQTACFRVAQEALTNVVRHAQARTACVEWRQQETQVDLSIVDDGVGFDVARARQRAAHGSSFGLLGMQERVQLLGGQIEFLSQPGAGTTIHVRLTVPDPHANQE